MAGQDGRVIPRGKVVYRPPERAIKGKIVVSPYEAPNHVKVTHPDGNVVYIELSAVVVIEE